MRSATLKRISRTSVVRGGSLRAVPLHHMVRAGLNRKENEVKEYIIGGLVGFIVGIVLLAYSLDDWSRVSKNDTGWYTHYDGRLFRLVEVNTHE